MNNELLLCTDLDRTLLPNGAQAESGEARQCFNRFVDHPDITLAYVTGRDKVLVQKAMIYYNLPIPDYVIADVGATIYKLHSSKSDACKAEAYKPEIQWELWHDWQSYFVSDWKGKTNQEIAKLFSDISELRKQEVNKQKQYKLSYYVPLYIEHHALIESMQKRLHAAEINAELIWSVDEPLGLGLLDVMPKHATKRNAIEYLMKEKQFDVNNTLFAGDSGNDLDVLLSPIKSILVANAHEDVKKTLLEALTLQKATQNTNDSIYLAQGGFQNMNGNYSAGILEGVQFYFPKINQWLKEKV